MNMRRLAVVVLVLGLADVLVSCREPTRQPTVPSFDLGVPEGSSHITWTNYPNWPPQLSLQASSTGDFWGSSNVRSSMWWGTAAQCDSPVPQRRFGQESDGSYNQDNDPNPPAYSAVAVIPPDTQVTGTRVRARMETLHSFFEFGPYQNNGQTAQTNSTAEVCLDAPHVETVTIAPATASICTSVGSAPLTATVKDQYQTVVTSGTVTWSSNNANAATVTQTGPRTATVNGGNAGVATITGTHTGINGTSTVTVSSCAALAAPTSCTIQYIPPPNYLKVAWVNNAPGASTTVEINRNGNWTSPVTQAPGITQYFYIRGSQTGIWYARVRHVKTGFPSSAYCTTSSITAP